MKNRKLYFMGIKGVGMTSLAVIAKQAGSDVIGSDIEEEFITDEILKKEGIKWNTGFSEQNVKNFFQGNSNLHSTLIYTSAHEGYTNCEVQYASRNGFEILTHGQAVGAFMDGRIIGRKDLEGISVAGAHGKTTITAMLAVFFQKLGLDPSYTVGTSKILGDGISGHYGKGKYFIAEADEYVSEINHDKTPKFLYQHPRIAIINNIDFDHPDFYNNLEEVKKAYISFVKNIKNDGMLILNGDDKNIKLIKSECSHVKNIITYGYDPSNDYYIAKHSQDEFNSYFSICSKNIYLGDFKISVPGFHNVKNCLSIIVLLLEIGVSIEGIRKVLPFFLGTRRRIERLGMTKNRAIIIDDYAHHPQEIKTSLAAIREVYPRKKIVCIFQPHTFSRTKTFFKEFISAFLDTDFLLLLPVYASLREKRNDENLSDELFYEIKKIKNNTSFFKEKDFVVKYIQQNLNNGETVIVTMGAGDVYKIAESLIKI